MKTIRGLYTQNGIENINNDSHPDFPILGTVTIQYPKRTKDYDAGVYCGLLPHCTSDSIPSEIEKFIESEDWNFDVHLCDILEGEHKRYVVRFVSLETYGVMICTNNIVEFITGVASCPTQLPGLNYTAEDWKDLKYLDTKTVIINDILEKEWERDIFTLCAKDLPINPVPITVNFYPY